MIISSGVGSGLDVEGLVSQLVAVEGQAEATRLARNEAALQFSLSAFGSVQGALSRFEDALEKLGEGSGFNQRGFSLSAEDALGITIGEGGATGNYSIEVIALASAQRLSSAAYADADTDVGDGTLNISLGTDTLTLEIGSDDKSLAAIADAINAAADNPGVTASVLTADDGARLVLSANDTGLENTITVTASGGDGGLAALTYDPANSIANLTEITAAGDAEIKIDGFSVTRPTNSFSDAIEGVTIDIDQAETGVTTGLSVEIDREAATKAVDEFVNAYNALQNVFSSVTRYDPETGSRGALLGDSSVRGVANNLRASVSERMVNADAVFSTLVDIGVTSTLEGQLEIDQEKLDAAIDGNLTGVERLFADANNGLATRLNAVMQPFTEDNGIFAARTEGIESSIERIDERRDALNRRLESVEVRYRRQFIALDGLLASLNGQSEFLGQQLASLPGFTNNES